MASTYRAQVSAAVLVSQLCMAQIVGAQQNTPPLQPPDAAAPPAAVAQPEQPDEVVAAAEGSKRRTAEEEIVVTGTRVRRKDLTTPAPITVISRKEMESSGRVSIGDFLQTLPEQGNAINTSINNGGNGSTRVSLRGLGAERTLVLLNGRRYVPGGNGANSSVDLNSIPSAVIERVEVLKDGASAIYGSDAIAGVINLITRKRFNGAEATGYLGTSGHGDGKVYDFSATAGTAGDRGSLMFSAGYYQQTAAWSGDRDFSKVPTSYDGSETGPLRTIGPYSQGSGTTPEGTINLNDPSQRGRPLAVPPPTDPNYQKVLFYNRLVTTYPTTNIFIRDPNASVCLSDGQCWRPYRGALLADQNGDGYNFSPDNYLVTPQQRISLYSIGETKLGRFARGYFEGAYVNRQSSQKLAAEPLVADRELVSISRFNIYNPFGRDFSAGPGTTRANAGGVQKRLLEVGNRNRTQDIDSFRVVIGLDGTLPPEAPGILSGWFWDLSLNYGRTVAANVQSGSLFLPALRDAVGPSMLSNPADPNSAVCVRTPGDLSTAIPGCVPLNLFGGPNSITADQLTGLTYVGVSRGLNQMTAFQFNTSGELFKLLGDRPVGLAAGYEYRIVAGENIPDPVTVQGNTTGNKGDITKGHYYVHEGYGELSVPILSGLPFARELEATAAARLFKYSNFGSDITYKVGGRWSVIPDFTVRGTYSTGFRAPSIIELFQGQSDSFPNRQDPCRGPVQGGQLPLPPNCLAQGIPAGGTLDAATQLRSRIGGNPDLKPETAKIYTAGLVIEPSWVKNLTITADYYNITVDKTITTIGTATILSGCYPTDPSVAPRYCELIIRDPDANFRIRNIINTNTNVGQDATDGIDIALNYVLPTEYGRFAFLFDGTWLHKYDRTLADGTVVKGKGTFDLGTTGGVYPAFKFNSGLRYGIRGLSAGVTMRFIGSFKECGTPSGQFAGSGLCYVDSTYQRRVKHYDIYDVFVSYSLQSIFGRTQFALGVNNLFDKPPAVIYNGFTASTDPTAYDLLGRFFYGRLTQTF